MYTYDLGYSTLGALILMEKATQSGKGESKGTFSLRPMEPVGSFILEGGASNVTRCQPKKASTQLEQHEELGSYPGIRSIIHRYT